MIPRRKGITCKIIELKRINKSDDVEIAIKKALEQIDVKKYDANLIKHGFENAEIRKVAIVFQGLEVFVRPAT